MILLDLFSGIGGFSLGLDKWVTKHYYSEIDKHAIAIYKHNFKESIYVGSVESIGDIERPNIITFGSPCQDFSIAGKRSGLEGSRSSLIQYALNTISKFRPDVFIWENVKGVFSSNDGADFWAIVKAFADIGGYRLEWQLLNTAWFLPQNRERIYLIGHLAEGSTRNIFPIGEDNTEVETNRIKIIGTTKSDTADGTNSRSLVYSDDGIVTALDATMWKQPKQILVEPVCMTRKSFDGNEADGKRAWREHKTPNQSPVLNAQMGMGGDNVPYVVESNAVEVLDDYNSRIRDDGNTCSITPNTGSKTRRNGQKLILTNSIRRLTEIDTIQSNAVEVKAVKVSGDRGKQKTYTGDNIGSLSANPMSDNLPKVSIGNNSIRRLTEIECERLQGFPDNWTQYGDYNEVKKVSKTQRYKCLGNAVTVNVVRAIGTKLFEEN